MGFLQWWWKRSELYVKIIFIYVVVLSVMLTLTITYESQTMYRITQGIAISYFVWWFGYEMVYKAIKAKYNTYIKEQENLFNEIRDPK